MNSTDKIKRSVTWQCFKCKVPLVMGKVKVSYLGSDFQIDLFKCPGCGAVLVPEDLATGKMLEVEKSMEDK
ncbi:MAG TPA: hypothetical protein GXX72_07455 [Clostridiaceae bacterium]|nr:hypothetical protein [Clostridiaceae bacterium]